MAGQAFMKRFTGIVAHAVNTEAEIMMRQGEKFPYVAQALLEMTIRGMQFYRENTELTVQEAIRAARKERRELNKKLRCEAHHTTRRWLNAEERLIRLAIFAAMQNPEHAMSDLITNLEAMV